MKPHRLLGLASIAVVACSTYGANEPSPADTDGGTSSGGGSSGATSSSGNASSSGGSSGATEGGPPDAGDDAPTFGQTCPPCTSGTCVPAGCNGAGPNNACNVPYDVTATTTLTVFACPEGPTVELPNQPACQNGGPSHGALIRLGAATTNWNVKASGTNPYAVGGDCNGFTAVSCGSSTVSRDFNPLITIMVGTSTRNIQTCVPISVTLTKN